VAFEEVDLAVVVLLLSLFIFRAGTLDTGILLLRLPYTTSKREVKKEDDIQAPWRMRDSSGDDIAISERKVEVKEEEDKVAMLLLQQRRPQ
jgi:hypothetical protein